MTQPKKNEGFLEHLEVLRFTLIKCLIAVGVLYIPSYLLTPYAIAWLITWSCPPELTQLNFFSPLEVFVTRLKMASVFAVFFAFPYCLLQAWQFLLPALYENEKKALKLWVFASCLLFVLGFVFCVIFILPLLMDFSASFVTPYLNPVIRLSSFLNLSGWLMLAFGAMFQFPIAIMLGVRFSLFEVSFLKEKRPYIAVGILIVSAIITPPDIISQIALALPTYILFELGLFLSLKFQKEEKEEEKKAVPKTEEKQVLNEEDEWLSFYQNEEKRPPTKKKKKPKKTNLLP